MAGPIAPLMSSTTACLAATACGSKGSIASAIARMGTAHRWRWVHEWIHVWEPALIDRGCMGGLLLRNPSHTAAPQKRAVTPDGGARCGWIPNRGYARALSAVSA